MRKIPIYTIESGIPVPEQKRRNFMLSQLEVGDSILVPAENRASAASSASHIKKRTGKEFTFRKADAETVRVWRTK